ncbi:hypothetical protein ACNHFS_004640, partial [Yersinia enterocolitica]
LKQNLAGIVDTDHQLATIDDDSTLPVSPDEPESNAVNERPDFTTQACSSNHSHFIVGKSVPHNLLLRPFNCYWTL